MPIAMLLHTDGRHERPGGDATVTISHRYTPKEQLKMHTRLADIVVAAAGIPNLITADMIKEGAAVIDVGINRVQDPVTGKPKLVGDVDFEGRRTDSVNNEQRIRISNKYAFRMSLCFMSCISVIWNVALFIQPVQVVIFETMALQKSNFNI
ncbi:bifunctional methylenetetrahydrofolate dehydrogenase cyclohydrolase, mitochondrial [Pelobates cultripes]|uniref:Bifunctional methylenetetrahydrofolate dehydrogenase cyclohydrolase, mitochondrial n=1 Tax=Pelobates cultripes TaxID=61616 RepID=A0AAD1RMU2_PELCU|nr:bifunctional methylenetetrahydrofolate dehydrogenase cyclohydrolase, mitochondrial [Pelobates cultripes]